MLDHDDVNLILDSLTLPRGMKASASHDLWEGVQVRIVYTVENSFRPGEQIDLGISSYLSPNDLRDEETVQRWVIWRVWRIYGHEAREQVQRDGRPISDPHASERE